MDEIKKVQVNKFTRGLRSRHLRIRRRRRHFDRWIVIAVPDLGLFGDWSWRNKNGGRRLASGIGKFGEKSSRHLEQ